MPRPSDSPPKPPSREPPKTVAAKSRQVALLAAKVRGPWSQTAAEVALAGSDKDVTNYVVKGWKDAAQQDDRARVENLALMSELDSVRTTAETALKGDASKISAFLTTGQYQAAEDDFRGADREALPLP